MIAASCHCGAVQIRVPQAPSEVTSCNCSICRRSGTLAAYYDPAEVTIAGDTDTYMWGDKMMIFHRCKVCGCATHGLAVDPASKRMSVNARLMPPTVLAAARVRKFDGADTWSFLEE
ncbi:MAG TPA: hypothetical protein VGG36_11890 [Rhizomicrobium sp.]|jgi:hypothetical protein